MWVDRFIIKPIRKISNGKIHVEDHSALIHITQLQTQTGSTEFLEFVEPLDPPLLLPLKKKISSTNRQKTVTTSSRQKRLTNNSLPACNLKIWVPSLDLISVAVIVQAINQLWMSTPRTKPVQLLIRRTSSNFTNCLFVLKSVSLTKQFQHLAGTSASRNRSIFTIHVNEDVFQIYLERVHRTHSNHLCAVLSRVNENSSFLVYYIMTRNEFSW